MILFSMYDNIGYCFTYIAYYNNETPTIDLDGEDLVDTFWSIVGMPDDFFTPDLREKIQRIHWLLKNQIPFTVTPIVNDYLHFSSEYDEFSERGSFTESLDFEISITDDNYAIYYKLLWGPLSKWDNT